MLQWEYMVQKFMWKSIPSLRPREHFGRKVGEELTVCTLAVVLRPLGDSEKCRLPGPLRLLSQNLVGQWLAHFSEHYNHLENLLKHRSLGLSLQVSDPVKVGDTGANVHTGC